MVTWIILALPVFVPTSRGILGRMLYGAFALLGPAFLVTCAADLRKRI